MHPEILSQKQHELLPLIREFSREYYLVGGTAVAYYIGHRQSIDFDLFKKDKINPKRIKEKISSHKFPLKIIHEESDQIHFLINDVKLTFFSFGYAIPHPNKFAKFISMPNLLDLSAMKAFALGGRAKWKDYVDMYYLLKDYYSVKEIAIRAGELFGDFFSYKLFRQQLCYFKDINYSEEVEFMQGFEVHEKTVKDFLTDIATSSLL